MVGRFPISVETRTGKTPAQARAASNLRTSCPYSGTQADACLLGGRSGGC